MIFTEDDIAAAISDHSSDYYPLFWPDTREGAKGGLYLDFHAIPRGTWDAAVKSGWALYIISKICRRKRLAIVHTLPDTADLPQQVVQHIINGPPKPCSADIWVSHHPIPQDYDRYIMAISIRPNHRFMPALRRDKSNSEA